MKETLITKFWRWMHRRRVNAAAQQRRRTAIALAEVDEGAVLAGFQAAAEKLKAARVLRLRVIEIHGCDCVYGLN